MRLSRSSSAEASMPSPESSSVRSTPQRTATSTSRAINPATSVTFGSGIHRRLSVLLGCLPGPSLEGPEEGGWLRVAEEERDLVGGELAVGEVGEGDGPACVV